MACLIYVHAWTWYMWIRNFVHVGETCFCGVFLGVPSSCFATPTDKSTRLNTSTGQCSNMWSLSQIGACTEELHSTSCLMAKDPKFRGSPRPRPLSHAVDFDNCSSTRSVVHTGQIWALWELPPRRSSFQKCHSYCKMADFLFILGYGCNVLFCSFWYAL